MELHMREQSRQVDQERWRLTQEESRLKAVQAALEDERRITMEQLSLQRAEVHVYYWNLISRVKATFFAHTGCEIKEMYDSQWGEFLCPPVNPYLSVGSIFLWSASLDERDRKIKLELRLSVQLYLRKWKWEDCAFVTEVLLERGKIR